MTFPFIFVAANEDYTLQLRCFEPEVMTYKDLKKQMKKEITAEVHTEERYGKEVLFYRNKYPTEVSELYGIGLEGLDGKLYKISIFTGEKEEYKKEEYKKEESKYLLSEKKFTTNHTF